MQFYNEVVNDWGELTLVPTLAGKLILAAVLLVLLALAVLVTRSAREKVAAKVSANESAAVRSRLRAKQVAFCAVAIALGTILSGIKYFHYPTGGSSTLLSMLVITLPGLWFGPAAGILTGVAYGILQLIVNPYVLYPAQLVVDYILAFGALGISGFFRNHKYSLYVGYVAGVTGRYIFAVISGALFFGNYAWDGWNPLPYSLVYNFVYIYVECAITLAVLFVPPVRKGLEQIRHLATED